MQVDVHAEPAVQPVDRDLDVHLREPGQELLAGLVVAPEHERGILLGEAAKRGCHLLFVALRLGRDRKAHDRLRKFELWRLAAVVLLD